MVGGCECWGRFDKRFLGDDAGSAQKFCPVFEDEWMGDAVLGFKVAGYGFIAMSGRLRWGEAHLDRSASLSVGSVLPVALLRSRLSLLFRWYPRLGQSSILNG